MYRPRRENLTQMKGGDYISSLSMPSTLTDISVSTLQYIMNKAQLTSIDAITSLTEIQLSTLTKSIDDQIREDEDAIAANQSTITALSARINDDGGLEDQYNAALSTFNGLTSRYNVTSTANAQKASSQSKDASTLTSLYALSTFYISSISSYQYQYDILLANLQKNASTIDIYGNNYIQQLKLRSVNTVYLESSMINYKTFSSIVASCLSSLNNVNNTPEQNNTISTSCSRDNNTLKSISTDVVTYRISESILSTSVYQTYSTIASMINISSLKFIEVNSYSTLLNYYLGEESTTQRTISSLEADIKRYRDEISTIDGTNLTNSGSLNTEISALTAQAPDFYNFLQNALDNECNEYVYGIQEYNAQLGWITASLQIAINNNSIEADNRIIQLIDNSLGHTETYKAQLRQERQDYETDNQAIYNIISQINVLDSLFNDILSFTGSEKSLKGSFVQKRKNIFDMYEFPALTMTLDERNNIKSSYYDKFTDINATIFSINDKIRRRKDKLRDINAIIDPLKASINTYFRKYLGLGSTADVLPNNLTRVLDINEVQFGGDIMPNESYNPTSNSEYTIIPPIDFII